MCYELRFLKVLNLFCDSESISKIKESIMGNASRVQGSIKPPQMQGKEGISALSITPPLKKTVHSKTVSGSELSGSEEKRRVISSSTRNNPRKREEVIQARGLFTRGKQREGVN